MTAFPNILARSLFRERARMSAYAAMAETLGHVPRAGCLRELVEDLGGPGVSAEARFVDVLATRMAKGETLSQAMSGWVPESERRQVAQVEATGGAGPRLKEIHLSYMARRRHRPGRFSTAIDLATAAAAFALFTTVGLRMAQGG